jgi:hypothetical protein
MKCDSVWFGIDIPEKPTASTSTRNRAGVADSSETSVIIHQGTRRHILLNVILIHVNAKIAVIMLAAVKRLTRPFCHC